MSWIRDTSLTFLQSLCVKIVKCGVVPRHVAFIMDGNRRYATRKKCEKLEGHSKGFDKLTETLQWCLELGIPEVTVYAFSIENFKRSPEEVAGLMELARIKFQRLLNEKEKLMEHGICIRVIGNVSLLPLDLRKLMAEAMLITKSNKRAVLNVAFAYTARDEMAEAVKVIVEGAETGNIIDNDVNKELIDKCIYTSKSPNPDLLIRTSGEVRLSDFLLWQISCCHIYFTNVLWPEFSFWHMLAAVVSYQIGRSSVMTKKSTGKSQVACINTRTVEFLNTVYCKRQLILEEAIQSVQL